MTALLVDALVAVSLIDNSLATNFSRGVLTHGHLFSSSGVIPEFTARPSVDRVARHFASISPSPLDIVNALWDQFRTAPH